MNGKQYPKSIFVRSTRTSIPVILEYFILFGIGIIAFLLHSRLRTPLNMPGHHGLEFMAILMAGRVASRIPWASSISSLGIGMMLFIPVYGIHDPFMGLYYMLPGFFIDVFYNMTKNTSRQMLMLAMISGLAYAMIPLSRLALFLLTGYPYQAAIKHGMVIPIIGFFVFGLAGGFTGGGITRSIIFKLRKK